MKTIKMLQTACDSQGPKLQGKQYKVSPEMAKDFVKAGAAVYVETPDESKTSEKTEAKTAQQKKETRDGKKSPESKSSKKDSKTK